MAAPQSNIDKKRMAKNTVLLYIRMFCLLLVGFYTVRLLLESLGVEDYGLYNVIFGLVTAFSFFSMAMQSTVQKFLCAEIGSGETGKARKVFGVSLFLFFILALLIILAAETIGLWFVHNK
ncbi:MAG: lipopolysaccharide biosynthesis protein, partial [Lentisphaeria bacterium]|nr:lipopolysaccharide biosynthesis protein [Lentisphaeria bacterium]